METSYQVKHEEELEPEKIVKYIKKEEDNSMKIENLTTKPIQYPQLNPFLNTMALSWIANQLRFPYMPFNLNNLQQMNALLYRKRPFQTFQQNCDPNSNRKIAKKPFKILKESVRRPPTLKVPIIKVEEKIIVKCEATTPSIQTETDASIQVKPQVTRTKKKKTVRVSGCKNYIGLVTAGFARIILTAQKGGHVMKHMEETFSEKKANYDSLKALKIEQFIDGFQKHVYKMMCGKKVKQSNKDRDFKIRNSEELDTLLNAKEEDDDNALLIKDVLREMVEYFFESDAYYQWISNGMMTEVNRFFFIKNKGEVHKKFSTPMLYKPRFNHNLDEQVVV